jgi:predicted DNA-binding transcriptional regulator AlpA
MDYPFPQAHEPPTTPPEGEMLTIKQTAATLGVATSTIHRWLNDGIIAGEQLTPGAPWRIRLTDHLRSRVAEEAPEGYLTMCGAGAQRCRRGCAASAPRAGPFSLGTRSARQPHQGALRATRHKHHRNIP